MPGSPGVLAALARAGDAEWRVRGPLAPGGRLGRPDLAEFVDEGLRARFLLLGSLSAAARPGLAPRARKRPGRTLK